MLKEGEEGQRKKTPCWENYFTASISDQSGFFGVNGPLLPHLQAQMPTSSSRQPFRAEEDELRTDYRVSVFRSRFWESGEEEEGEDF